MSRVSYNAAAERPGLGLWLRDSANALINFSSGYSFTFKVGPRNGAALLTKTSNIAGAAGDGEEPTGTPNVVILWAAGELALPAGVYHCELTCTTSSADRVFEFDMVITAALA